MGTSRVTSRGAELMAGEGGQGSRAGPDDHALPIKYGTPCSWLRYGRSVVDFSPRQRPRTPTHGVVGPLSAAVLMLAGVSRPSFAEGLDPLPEGHDCHAEYKMVESSTKYSKKRIGRLEDLFQCLKWKSPKDKIRIAQAADAIEQTRKVREFIGTDVGVGLAGVMYSGETPVTEAYVDGMGVVRASEFLDDEIRVMAVVSRLAWTWKQERVGLGPLAVVNIGSQGGSFSSPITSLGAGFMLAVRGPDDTGHGLGVGMAYAIDGNLRTLRDDFVPGRAAPVGADGQPLQIEYARRSRQTLLLLVSYNF